MLSRFIAALVAMAIVNLASSLAFAASISLSVQAGPPDTKTIVKGTGLGANAIHEVYFGLQQLTFGVTDGAGKLTLELNIPETALPGNQVISIIPHSGNGASAQKFFEVRTNWTQWHHDAASTGRVAFDNVLKTTTVKNLGLSWRLPACGPRTPAGLDATERDHPLPSEAATAIAHARLAAARSNAGSGTAAGGDASRAEALAV